MPKDFLLRSGRIADDFVRQTTDMIHVHRFRVDYCIHSTLFLIFQIHLIGLFQRKLRSNPRCHDGQADQVNRDTLRPLTCLPVLDK